MGFQPAAVNATSSVAAQPHAEEGLAPALSTPAGVGADCKRHGCVQARHQVQAARSVIHLVARSGLLANGFALDVNQDGPGSTRAGQATEGAGAAAARSQSAAGGSCVAGAGVAGGSCREGQAPGGGIQRLY